MNDLEPVKERVAGLGTKEALAWVEKKKVKMCTINNNLTKCLIPFYILIILKFKHFCLI